MGKATLLLRPADVLMFRDSRPFGQVPTDTGSEFPAPRTVAGAIRTWLLSMQDVDLSRLRRAARVKTTRGALESICPPGHSGHWVLDAQLAGPLLCHADGPTAYFPVPRTLAIVRDKKSDRSEDLLMLHPMESAPSGWTAPLGAPSSVRPLWVASEKNWDLLDPDWFVDASAMENYLAGISPNRIGMQRQEQCLTGEARMGIGINSDTNTTNEGDLYASVFMRPMEFFGFVMQIQASGTEWLEKIKEALTMRSWVRLGGEGKFARIELLDEGFRVLPAPPCTWPPESGRFLTCLATPALFEKGGWIPRKFSKRFTLVGATANVPRTVSGWDVGHNRPLPYRSAAPAGSVYFWELKKGEEPGDDPHGQCISDEEDDNQAGWGLCLRGDWQ